MSEHLVPIWLSILSLCGVLESIVIEADCVHIPWWNHKSHHNLHLVTYTINVNIFIPVADPKDDGFVWLVAQQVVGNFGIVKQKALIPLATKAFPMTWTGTYFAIFVKQSLSFTWQQSLKALCTLLKTLSSTSVPEQSLPSLQGDFCLCICFGYIYLDWPE